MSRHSSNNSHPEPIKLNLNDLRRFQAEIAAMEEDMDDKDAIEFAQKFAMGKTWHPSLEAAYQKAFPTTITFKLCPDPSTFAGTTLSATPHLQSDDHPLHQQQEQPQPKEQKKQKQNDQHHSTRYSCQVIPCGNLRSYIIPVHHPDGDFTIDAGISENAIYLEFIHCPIPVPQMNICVVSDKPSHESIPTQTTDTTCTMAHDLCPVTLADVVVSHPGTNGSALDITIQIPPTYKRLNTLLSEQFNAQSKIIQWWHTPHPALDGQTPINQLIRRQEDRLVALLTTISTQPEPNNTPTPDTPELNHYE